jgi:prophage antirepressor-like protein
MAYSNQEKQEFAERVAEVKKALRKKGIKYYGSAARVLDENANQKLLHNVMQGQTQNEGALALLERVAGIEKPEMASAA